MCLKIKIGLTYNHDATTLSELHDRTTTGKCVHMKLKDSHIIGLEDEKKQTYGEQRYRITAHNHTE